MRHGNQQVEVWFEHCAFVPHKIKSTKISLKRSRTNFVTFCSIENFPSIQYVYTFVQNPIVSPRLIETGAIVSRLTNLIDYVMDQRN